jgi:broad specificity phosphatase PhoE
MSTRITFARHSKRMDDHENPREVQEAVDRVWDCPLDEEGIGMAKAFATKLEKPEIVITSPMLRCFQTAGAALSVWGGIIQVDARWCEVWHPKVLKTPIQEVYLRSDAEYREHYPLFAHLNTILPNTEETRGQGGMADARFIRMIHTTAAELKSANIKTALVVSHGDMLQSVASVIGGMSVYEVNYMASITVDYDWTTKKFTLVGTDGIGYMME